MEDKKQNGWICTDDEQQSDEKRILLFRKVIELSAIPVDCLLRITADSKYKLYINGEFVNTGPQKGDDSIWYFDELDIKPFLKNGKNVFLVKVLTIPDRFRAGNFSFFRTETPGLYLNGCVSTDSSWKYMAAEITLNAEDEHFAPMQVLETAESLDGENEMFYETYDDRRWMQVKVYSDFDLSPVLIPDALHERTIPLLKTETERFNAVQCIRSSEHKVDAWNKLLGGKKELTIAPGRKEIVEINAGAETTGYLVLKLAEGTGAEISILCSECYAYEAMEEFGDHFMPRKGDRTDSENGKLYGFTDCFTVSGEGNYDQPEVYEPFWFRTFRYIKLTVETADRPVTILDFYYRKTAYPLEVSSKVETSDESMAKIWEISERTLRLCMHETYEDCPFYEQLQYAMDSRSQILYTYAVSADDRLARQCMDDFRRSLRHDGMIKCSYPNYEMNVIPGFAVYYIGMLYDHMMYFGDKDFLLNHVPAVLGILSFFRNNITGSGLLGKTGGILFEHRFWSFIDWTKEWRDTIGVPPAIRKGPLTMENLLYILGLQYASGIFNFLDYGDMSRQAAGEAEKIQDAVNRYCRGKGGMYIDGPSVDDYSQHTQVFAILTDTVDIDTGRKYLLETLDNPGQYAQCSVAMMYYLFRALEKCDLYERTDELWDVWRGMLSKNLTTCEEDPVSSRSDCHAWGALALYELPSAVLGIRPAAPGFSEIELSPKVGRFSHAEGSVITPKGTVSVSWKREDGGIDLNASVPEGIKVTGKYSGSCRAVKTGN